LIRVKSSCPQYLNHAPFTAGLIFSLLYQKYLPKTGQLDLIRIIGADNYYTKYKLYHIICSFDPNAAASPELYSQSLHHPANAMKLYRPIYLTVKLASSFFCGLTLFGQTAILLICTVCLYLGLGNIGTAGQKILSILFFVATGSYGTTVIYLGGEVHVKSGELLEAWKRNYIRRKRTEPYTNWTLEERKLNSLQPMKIYAGDMYYLDRRSVLVLWEAIIDKTIFMFSL